MATAQTTPTTSLPETDLEFRASLARLSTLIVFCILLVVGGMYVLAPYFAWGWSRQPFIGAVLEPTLILNGDGPKEWALIADGPTDLHGTNYPDQLLELDGVAIQSIADLNRMLAGYAPGDTVTLTYKDAQGPSWGPHTVLGQRTVSVTLVAFSISDGLSLFVIPYFVGLAFLLIGIWVFRLRRHETVGRLFALFCACMAVVLGGYFDNVTTHLFSSLWAASLPMAAASVIALAMVFPQETQYSARYPLIRWIIFIPAGVNALFSVWLVNDFTRPGVYAAAWLASFILIALGALFFLGSTAYRWLRASSPVIRDQSRIIMLGSSVAFLPAVSWILVTIPFPEIKFNSWLFVFLVAFPFSIAYAIFRYRLLNTELVLSRTVVYVTLGILISLGYFLLANSISLLVGTALAETAASPILIGLTVFILVFAFNPVRNWLQGNVDLYFFHGSQAYREQLQTFGRSLTESSDLPYIAGQLRQQIEITLKPAHLHLFLRDQSRTEYGAYVSSGRPDTDLRFSAEGALARFLSTERRTLYLAPDSPLPSGLVRDRARLAVLGSPLFVPLNSKAGLIGWLALGNRLSGEPYTPQDLEFLESLADQSALAIERALAFESLEKRVKELNVLSQVSQAVNFSIAFDDLLELVYAQTSRVLDLRNFTIIMRDQTTQTLKYAFFVENDERDASRENKPWPMGQGLASEVIRTGQALLTDDYLGECSRRRITPLNRPYHAWMGAPLNAASGTLGAMTVATLEPGHAFTQDQLKIFAAIADQAATAIDKARLYSQTQERARQLATLNQVAQVITSTLDLDTLLERILESAVAILGCEAGSLFLVDDETSDSVLRVAVGPVARDIIGIRVPAGRGIVGSAAETGQPVIVNDTANDPRWFQKADKTTGFVSRAVMAVPLRVKERNIGVLEVINKRNGLPFTDEDTALLTAFAGQAAVAIENARLFNLTDQALAARVEELSIMQRIDRELNAALDVRRVMTVILDRALVATNANAGLAGLVLLEGIQVIAHKGYGEAIKPYLDSPLPTDKGLIGKAVATKSTSLLRDVRSHPDYVTVLPNTAAQLTIPIVREEESIGVLLIESQQPDCFTDDHVAFLTRLADHAVIAVTNARLYGEVNAANQAKTEFVSMVSHELKNPMQSIKGYTQLLTAGTAGPINEGQQHFLNIVQGNVERMITIVSDLTDIARIESSRLQLNIRPMQFRAVIDEVVRSMQSAYDAKQQTMIVEVEDHLPLVMGDNVRLVQILTNLVSNAHKYSPVGGVVTLRTRVSANVWDPQGAPQVLHISVQDTGYGIAPEDQDKIFSKFFRADNNLSDAPGTGLGLNIVKQMVELGGGKVWFESELGRGSTFHFTVPLAPKESPITSVS